MKKILLMLCVFYFSGQSWGQEVKNFKEVHKINLQGFPETKFKYTLKKDPSVELKKTNILYGKHRDTISYNIEEKKKPKEHELNETVLSSIGLVDCSWSKVNLDVKDNKVYIYPFRYNNNYFAEKFFAENDVYLELKERLNYSFNYSSFQVGFVTIPVKWYMTSRIGNIETNVNAMISGGYKFGKSHVAKLPHEEKARQYQSTWSINVLVGISKLSFDDNNTIKDASIKGNVAAISGGFSIGAHYQDFTFLAAIGMDFSTSNRKSWEFNSTPWLGFGFGYNFIKIIDHKN